ncbi:hypothetical protein ABFS83_03G005200 [Erythranthe nasuta]
MARTPIIPTHVIVVALVAAMVVAMAAEAAERSGSMHCMTECYFECMQISIFNEGECKRECTIACAKQVTIRKASMEEDQNEFFPLWI